MHHKKIILVLLFFINICVVSTFVVSSKAFFSQSKMTSPAIFFTQQWKPAHTELEIIRNEKHYSTDEKIREWDHDENTKITQDGNVLLPVDQQSSSISQTITITQAAYFSFLYTISTSEDAAGFDLPVQVLFNDEVVYADSKHTDGVWKQAALDLSKYVGQELKIVIKSENTVDNDLPPVVEIKNATTTKLFVNGNDLLLFTPSKEVASISVQFSSLIDGEIVQQMKELSYPYQLSLTEQLFPEKISYYSTDLYGNVEEQQTVAVASQVKNKTKISNVELTAETEKQVSIRFEVADVDNHGIVVTKLSLLPFVTSEDWNSAQILLPINHRKYGSSNIVPVGGGAISLLFNSVPEGLWHIAIAHQDMYGNTSQFVSAGSVLVE